VRARVFAVADPTEVQDPAYLEGLRSAIGAAIDYALAGIQSPARDSPPIPPQLLVQARLAAQNQVGLDLVLRRYVAGYNLLGDFLIAGAPRAFGDRQLEHLLRSQATRFDRVLREVSEEHRREERRRERAVSRTVEERKLELARRLLEGEPLDCLELGYDLEGTHVAVMGRGEGIREPLRALASRLRCGVLVLRPDGETIWAWLRFKDQLQALEAVGLASAAFPPAQVSVALGEPGEGATGWRLTHRQAHAALAIATCSPKSVVRYRDVALVASLRKDELLAASLRSLYLEPLRHGRGSATAQETLRAYFASARNVSSTAAALSVSRQTVSARLLAIEQRLGQPIDRCATEVELALRLEGGDQGIDLAN